LVAAFADQTERPRAQAGQPAPQSASQEGSGTLAPQTVIGQVLPSPPADTVERILRRTAAGSTPRPLPIPVGQAEVPPPEDAPASVGSAVRADEDFTIASAHSLTEISSSVRSSTHESSLGHMGSTVFYTANWYAAISTNGGQSFSYIDPYSFFSSVNDGFCCDQVVQYARAQDMMLWLLQYHKDSNSGTQRLAKAVGAAVAQNAWSYWDLTPQHFGFANGNWLDYPNLTVGSTYLYGNSNVFLVSGGFSGSVLWRIPLAQLAAGGNVSYEYKTWTNQGSVRCTDGATTTMYCGFPLDTDTVRFWRWSDNEGSPASFDIDVTPFTWLNDDGVATNNDGTNWAGKLDSRPLGAWFGKGQIGLVWSAKQDANFAYPYTNIARFDAATMTLNGHTKIWNPNYAWLYGTAFPNASGDVAGLIYAGAGGVYPTAQYWIVDEYSPSFSSLAFHGAASSAAGPSNNRWGDYVTVRQNGVNIHTWVGAFFTMGSGGDNEDSLGVFSAFGRSRDFGATNRPTSITTAATSVGRLSATLNGTVNPNGNSTSVHFQYGLTSSYGSATLVLGAGGSTSPQPRTHTLSSLTCGTTYHARLVATNSGGTSRGNDVVFNTPACQAPTVTTQPASGMTETSANLAGSVHPNGLSTTTGFDHGTTTSYGSSSAGNPVGGDFSQSSGTTLTGLQCGTLYHFRAKATNALGTRFGSDATFQMAGCVGPTMVLHPTGHYLAFGATITLSAFASGSAPMTYQWYRGASGVTTSPIAGATSASYVTPPLSFTTRYWVRATNTAGSVSSATAKLILEFAEPIIMSRFTVVRAAHITELRNRINALRLAYGLGTFNFVDPALSAGITTVRAIHVSELRTALLHAYAAAKVTAPTFTNPPPTPSAGVGAQEIRELRNAIQALE
jgi:hypothetical protein